MFPENLRLDLVIIFFIYGLAFFGMGMALTLESWRMHRLVERRLLRPLAIFGLLHGAHEWLEIVLLQGVWQGDLFSTQYEGLRVAWLVVSFLALSAFGVLALVREAGLSRLWAGLGLLAVLGYFWLAIWLGASQPVLPLLHLDVYARYLLALPGGVLACAALLRQAAAVQSEGRPQVARWFRWAAVGFAFYGATQLVVAPIDVFPARFLNTQTFLAAVGFPVQVMRAAAAVWITVALIRAVQIVERERERELDEARLTRLAALEQIQHELVARETLRRDLLRHVVLAQEDERARIARELHDETSQVITALSLDLATLKDIAPLTPHAREILQRLQDLSSHMSSGIYRLLRDLRPAQLDELGLVPALRGLADDELRQHGLRVALNIRGLPQRLDPLVETVLFRVSQEGLANVRRHAGVSEAELELAFEPEHTTLHIRDQGRGFDPDQGFHPPHGWGLAGMRERTEAVGGRFLIDSCPGSGTHFQIVVPLAHTPPQEL
jgi:signal transduction histidine kinase